MIQLSNGHKIEYMAASGALKFDGRGWPHEKYFLGPISQLLSRINPGWEIFNPSLFTVVAKTVTFYPREGNYHWYWPYGCIRPIFRDGRTVGIVNAVGLTNFGFRRWHRKVCVFADSKKIPLVASIFSDDEKAPRDLAYMASIFEGNDLVGLVINGSCPNTPGDTLSNTKRIIESCQEVKEETSFPLLLKLSVVHDIKTILPEIKGIIEAISINSVPWGVIFPNRKSPLAHLGGGGVSGEVAQPYTWDFVKRLVDNTDIPIIGPSVWDFEDIAKLRQLGAKAISFGSVFLRYPWRPTQFVRKDMKQKGGE